MLFSKPSALNAKRLMILVPMLNFLSGFSVNLYVPSLPSLATHLDTSMRSVQSAVTIYSLGFALGGAVLGILLDRIEHRLIIILSLLVYTIANASAVHARTIRQFLSILFLQGAATAALSIGCRVIIKCYFEEARLTIAVLYASFAYGFAAMLGPLIGGYLEYYFGWTTPFYFLAFCGLLAFLSFILFVDKTPDKVKKAILPTILLSYLGIWKNKLFLFGTAVLGWIQLGLMIYPTFGPHFIENELHYSSIAYGRSAGVVSAGYLIGTLAARFLFFSFSQLQLIHIGFALSFGALVLQFFFLITMELNLLMFILPIALMGVASGFIFSNLLSELLKSFIHAGLYLSIQLCCIMAISSFGIFIINFFSLASFCGFFYIYLIINFFQFLFYYAYYRIKKYFC